MLGLSSRAALGVCFLAFPLVIDAAVPAASPAQLPPSLAKIHYSRAHTLGGDYTFNPKDGWMNVSTSDLSYKYDMPLAEPKEEEETHGIVKRFVGTISNALKGVFQGLKGIGSPQKVKITWYTGHDLKNPSCWSDTDWAPTDESFACALTMQGWKDKPACFEFLELCNNKNNKCVFVRVVDTCAGCAIGSKHVDLTRAAFSQLADLDEGILDVQMRIATKPEHWNEKLWGPKEKSK